MVTMKEKVLDEACEKHSDLPAYDDWPQYVCPFGCESARPGNYLMQMGLAELVRDAYLNNALTTRLPEIAAEAIDRTDDVSWTGAPVADQRMWIGTMEMMWERWGKGGWGEGVVVEEKDVDIAANPVEIANEKLDTNHNTTNQLDREEGVDVVFEDGTMVQVKTTADEPDESKIRNADELWWVNPGTGKAQKIK